MKKSIPSRWVVEKGRWSESENSFVDRYTEEFTQLLSMRIDGDILEFIGGPTGHERYYIKDLLAHPNDECPEFCICAGTINQWPACYVPRKQVFDFLKEEQV